MSGQEDTKFKENALKAGRRLLNLLILLADLALIGVSIYGGVLAIPFIASSLSAALALSFTPNWLILLIAVLPLIAGVTMLWEFIKFHVWLISYYRELISHYRKLNPLEEIFLQPLKYVIELLLSNFFISLAFLDGLQLDFIFPGDNAKKIGFNFLDILFTFNAVAGLAALGLGIFLTVKLMPLLMSTATVTLGMPYALAVLFGAAAAVTLIAISHQLLGLGIRLLWIGMQANFLKVNGRWHWEQIAYALVATLGIAAAGIAAHTFFWPLVSAVTPVLGTHLAIFLAIAISASLAVLMMKLLPQLLIRLPSNTVNAEALDDIFDPLPIYLVRANKFEYSPNKFEYSPQIGIVVKDVPKFAAQSAKTAGEF